MSSRQARNAQYVKDTSDTPVGGTSTAHRNNLDFGTFCRHRSHQITLIADRREGSGISPIGTKQTLASAMQMSAFGSEADMMQTSRVKLFQLTVQKNAFSAHERG